MVRAGNLLLLGSGQSVKLKTLSNTSINLILILVELFVRWVFFFLCFIWICVQLLSVKFVALEFEV
jgi:hypothetical protein